MKHRCVAPFLPFAFVHALRPVLCSEVSSAQKKNMHISLCFSNTLFRTGLLRLERCVMSIKVRAVVACMLLASGGYSPATGRDTHGFYMFVTREAPSRSPTLSPLRRWGVPSTAGCISRLDASRGSSEARLAPCEPRMESMLLARLVYYAIDSIR